METFEIIEFIENVLGFEYHDRAGDENGNEIVYFTFETSEFTVEAYIKINKLEYVMNLELPVSELKSVFLILAQQ